jgi:hypothetical protein
MKDSKDTEWTFAVENEEERDEWLDSLKMVMLQELDPKAKKQQQAEARAKSKGQKAPAPKNKKGVLAEKVLKEQVAAAFAKFDKDGSGSLDRQEIIDVCMAVGKNFSDAEIADMLTDLDKDNSGAIEYAEFETWWCKTFTGELVEGSNLAAVMAAWSDLEHLDGVAYHPDRYVDPDDEFRARVWYVFDEIDNNHDKHLSYIEFIK